MGPFKCPDCGIWWAGFEHRCQPGINTTAPTITTGPFVRPGTVVQMPYCGQCGYGHPPHLHGNTTLTVTDISYASGGSATGVTFRVPVGTGPNVEGAA